MKSSRVPAELPAFYANALPGLESIAADEIQRDLGGEIKRTERGLIVFKLEHLDESILNLRTTEDVFILAWGTDALTHRAIDLKSITHWSRKPDWKRLLSLHHSVQPKTKGKPSYRFVCQMQGTHVYQRKQALKAMAEGIRETDAIPASWKMVEENGWLEIWLSIHKERAVCGIRLSDRTMRHRTYKTEHMPASLRPTVAAAMVRLAGAAPGMTVLDPMCGAGTILAEQIELSKLRRAGRIETWGGDLDMNMLRAAVTNLKKLGPCLLARWDATKLPFGASSVERIICNPPFGKQISDPESIKPLYRYFIKECNRVLKPGGRVVLLVSDQPALREAIEHTSWSATRQYSVEILGQGATISVWQKPA
ncbi:RNA methyltransferase [Telmatocola sphagniphila]|uniref:RNA methyltransferase n=1 Tax=Telmatocola sphagniphila TaxID=1123043 RepID=A0A8E6EZ55_9BACT|nr:methyltransferase domain-containing protein [Telmatocola sphagniphila]QVL33383.1 RNA methyltransferase [Telmatocola sphagniphila]